MLHIYFCYSFFFTNCVVQSCSTRHHNLLDKYTEHHSRVYSIPIRSMSIVPGPTVQTSIVRFWALFALSRYPFGPCHLPFTHTTQPFGATMRGFVLVVVVASASHSAHSILCCGPNPIGPNNRECARANDINKDIYIYPKSILKSARARERTLLYLYINHI